MVSEEPKESGVMEELMIQLKPDRWYEVVRLGVTDKRAVQEINQHKVKPLVLFEVQAKLNGTFVKPDYYAIYEHTTKTRLIAQELATLETISSVDAAVFSVPELTSFSVRSEKYYEFFAAWVREGQQDALQQFFVQSQPIKETYGRPEPLIVAQLHPVSAVPQGEPYYIPTLGGLVEWNHPSDPEALLSNEAFQKLAGPLFEKAISRMEMIIGKVVTS